MTSWIYFLILSSTSVAYSDQQNQVNSHMKEKINGKMLKTHSLTRM